LLKDIAAILVAWGPAGVLLLATLDSAGIPIPAAVDTLLIYLGAQTPSDSYLLVGLAVLGSVVGSLILFVISRKGGEIFLAKHTFRPSTQRLLLWFRKYGAVSIFIPALVPIPLPLKVFVIAAGALGMNWILFVGVVLAARVPRYVALVYLGTQLGEDAMGFLKAHAWHLTGGAIALGLFLYALLKVYERLNPERFQKLTEADGPLGPSASAGD
jgi:membrane protein YqaA with SNARE-associated domain